MASWIAAGISLAVFVGATQPEALRARRWGKIIPSVGLVWLIARLAVLGVAGGFLAVWLTVLLAFLWAPVISHYTSGWLLGWLCRFSSDEGGFRINYTAARIFAEERRFAEAIEAVRRELRKSPLDYEGHLLLAALHRELKQPLEAAAALAVVINNPAATEEQRNAARAGKEELRKEFAAAH
jgi:hypothetical protein